MKDKRSLLWFKNELRLHDNEILFRAATKATFVLPVYIIDPAQFQPGKLGFPKTNFFRTQFLLESLASLKTSLQKAEADLHVFVGRAEEIIPQLVRELRFTIVYASQEVGSEELMTQYAVEMQLKKVGVPLELLWQNTLYHADDIPWPIQRLPDT
ncbi:MAG: deoxyribodipyrimidine photo-lyase, partial [Cyclobacteriaceae bacterium]|nr:deoxyribodipyrimidine photo-lyase [Cyclobacteriaceae bacterium]